MYRIAFSFQHDMERLFDAELEPIFTAVSCLILTQSFKRVQRSSLTFGGFHS